MEKRRPNNIYASPNELWSEAFQTLEEKLLRVALYKLSDQHEAEDAVQQVFLQLYSRYSSRKNFKILLSKLREDKFLVQKLLYRSLHNHIIDHYRTDKSKQLVDFEKLENVNLQRDPSVEIIFDVNEELDSVNRDIQRLLTSDQQTVFFGRMQGKEYFELADEMDRGNGAVRALFTRGREHLIRARKGRKAR